MIRHRKITATAINKTVTPIVMPTIVQVEVDSWMSLLVSGVSVITGVSVMIVVFVTRTGPGSSILKLLH